jgi:hypothetical protein
MQLPRLSPEFPEPRPGIVSTRLRPLQPVTDGGDLLDSPPQRGVLVLYPRLERGRLPRLSILLSAVLRSRLTLRSRHPRKRERQGQHAEDHPNSCQSSQQNVSSTHVPDTSSKRRQMSLYQRSLPPYVIYKVTSAVLHAHKFMCVICIFY